MFFFFGRDERKEKEETKSGENLECPRFLHSLLTYSLPCPFTWLLTQGGPFHFRQQRRQSWARNITLSHSLFWRDWLNVGLSLVFPLWNSFATTNCVCNLNEGGSTYNFLILKKTPQLPQHVASLLFPRSILFTQEGTEVLIQYWGTTFLDRIGSSNWGMQHYS